MTPAPELTELVRCLHDACESIATGGQCDDEKYEAARRVTLEKPSIASAIPDWLRKARTGRQYWAFIKMKHGTYAARRAFLSAEFDHMFSVAEAGGFERIHSAVAVLSEAGTPESVQAAWRKCLDRRKYRSGGRDNSR